MVPSTFVTLEQLPLSSNGKVDRKALPRPGQGAARREQQFVPPRDPVELELARRWEELLGVRPVGVQDNFFELGGHSFAAVRLMAQIQRSFGVELSLAALLGAPTVEKLAVLLQGSAQAETGPLVSIQPAGTGKPFFFVHPVGGNVLCYVELAQRLGTERPFYGLQSRGLSGGQEPLRELSEMAASYLEAVRAVQPEGPYLLGGWSMGGVVALEMAHQLRQQGEQVERVVMLDSTMPSGAQEMDELTLMTSFIRDLGGRF